MRALLALLMLVGLARAGEQPAYSFQAGSINVPLKAGENGLLAQGVKLWHEGTHVHAQSIAWRMLRLADGRQFPEWAEILPGALGPQPDRVLLDTTRSTMPTMAVHTVLTPTRVHLVRREGPPERIKGAIPQLDEPELKDVRPGSIWLRLTAESVGDFTCHLRNKGVWHPHRGWCERMSLDLEVLADAKHPQARDPQLRRIVMEGSAERRARLEVLDERPADQRPWFEAAPIVIHISISGDMELLWGQNNSGSEDFWPAMVAPFLAKPEAPK